MATGPRLKCRAVLPACVALLLVGGATPVAAAEPRVPVVFVHGLGGDATAWGNFGEVLTKQGWKFGGCPQVDRKTWRASNVCPAGTLSSGDVYRIQFSDGQRLTLKEQTEELRVIVASVLALNRGQAVAVVAHSMGGLAARSYLQLLRGEGVQRLITIGTPHGGAELAVICQEFRFACDAARIDPGALGVAELRPDSATMLTLNDLKNHPLPAISYLSIIGTGTPVRVAGSEDGDGIVTARAQNLGLLAGATALNHSARSVPVSECGKGPQTHTCELVDRGVWSLVLSNLREQVSTLAEAQISQATSDPKTSVSKSTASGQPELTFRMKDGNTVSGQLQEASVKVKSSVGLATVPVKDIVSFSDGQLRLKDGSVLKGELTATPLTVASKYGKLELKTKDVAWFGVGKPPNAEAMTTASAAPLTSGTADEQPSEQLASAAKAPQDTPASPSTADAEECKRLGPVARDAIFATSIRDRSKVRDEDYLVVFGKDPFDWGRYGIRGDPYYREHLRQYFGGWDKCVSWAQSALQRYGSGAQTQKPSPGRSQTAGRTASLPPASSQAGKSIPVRFVNESGGPVRLQISGNSKIEVGGKRWVTIQPGKSDEIPVMIGQQQLRVEQVKTAGFLITGTGGRFEKAVEIAPDATVRITNDDFK